MFIQSVVWATLASGAFAHVAFWVPGMYCRGGNNSAVDDANTNLVVNPLYELPHNKWWMQADRGCDVVPPQNGESLALPAGGSFTGEMAENRGKTTLSFNGQFTTEWTDGNNHPEDWHGPVQSDGSYGCIVEDGALHTHSQQTATGTAFAISYNSDIKDVTMENLVVFSVLANTPWKRVSTYDVPADLPPCPPGGCYCAWLWVPDGCGQPNMYMQNFKCHVTGSTSNKVVAKAKPPVYCADNPANCVKGPKQMIAWHQQEGNNVFPPNDVTPPYNEKMGFLPGAQNDIFEDPTSTIAPSTPSTSTTSSATPTVTPPANTKLGCYTDSPDARVLPTQVTVSNGLTPEKCVSACAAQGFSYAGVEYMSECWCGSTTPSSTLKADDSTCSLQCTGSSTETCGGAYLIDVYRTRSPVWTTAGCYFDAVSPRLLPDQKQVSGDMTVAKCLDACSEYAFAGVEFATQCFCGPSVDGGVKASDSDCNMPCAGDASVTCGGGNRINVYSSA